MKNIIELKTERLRITPLNPGRLTLLLADKGELERRLGLRPSGVLLDANTHEAISGLRQEGLRNQNAWVWYTYWLIVHISDNVAIGGLCFMKKLDVDGLVEVGYGIDAAYANNGYMTEALSAVVSWAKEQDEVVTVMAACEVENIASARVLENCGFLISNQDEELIYWKNAKKS